ncbi:OsmC family protein [Rummeliibacillus pycnus]|uniref:OsmC family protein n=1 Tax=Rummeliibacillus pycnus TaxID=101070 RepID=UPI001475053C|nr:OsmC family protein [Rummeliibacillus pycnus]
MDNQKTNVNAVWNGGIADNGTLKSEHFDIQIALSKSSGGSGNGADPKVLLVSSATTCYIETLIFMLESRGLPVDELTVNTDTTDGFTITHYPKIVLSADATEAQIESAQRIIEGADRGCKVGNLLRKAGIIISVQGEVSIK